MNVSNPGWITNKTPKKPNIKEKYNITPEKSFVEAGSGSLPTEKMESVALSFKPEKISVNKLYKIFISLNTPIIGYINNDTYFIDLKAIPDDQINLLTKSFSIFSLRSKIIFSSKNWKQSYTFIFKFYFFVKVVKPIFFPSIIDDEQCRLVLSKINIEPISHS